MLTERAPYAYRRDLAVPEFDDSGPVAVLDAQCGLCARGARWIARNDHAEVFRLIPLQSELGRALAAHYGVSPDDPATWIVIEGGRGFGALEAAAQAARHMGWRWRWLAVLRLVPRALPDTAYRLVARNRYRLFGRADLCALPDPEVLRRLMP
ncbi:putative membrane protein [Candidatus Rhodobacter oscarellae]|uniref:Putative membrane protein n=1 Tax=Candidatus Rhodobacter oscarellae TaxID=1675527 RepID=A0A0J9GRY1_9RHOB|nr:DCC1-like thiol-disulfide oxidoreductase family protein [Candidatus Rhodobacter lobularis]KMW56238.1 putative membrane protein [Candidatus Rhodobacter lobularis]